MGAAAVAAWERSAEAGIELAVERQGAGILYCRRPPLSSPFDPDGYVSTSGVPAQPAISRSTEWAWTRPGWASGVAPVSAAAASASSSRRPGAPTAFFSPISRTRSLTAMTIVLMTDREPMMSASTPTAVVMAANGRSAASYSWMASR